MTFWKDLAEQLTKHKKLILLLVVESIDSSPGRQGFKMLVTPTGDLYGSIGGGVMEFALVEEAKKQLADNVTQHTIKRQIHRGVKTEGSGMICSGEQTIAFIPLNKTHLESVNTLISHPNGVLHIDSKKILYNQNKQLSKKYLFSKTKGSEWSYQEQMHQKEKLYVIGGGHVGCATAQLCDHLGFDVVLLDNRNGLNTFEASAISKKYIVDYDTLGNYIEEGAHVYVAIMTHGYKGDKIALSALIAKQFKFIGVLGSLAKLKIMFDVLQSEGIRKDKLDKVHAPIGLFIKSETPDEIAISVAAQLIKVKNNS